MRRMIHQAHDYPDATLDELACGAAARCRLDWRCTRPKHDHGPHIARGTDGKVHAWWHDETEPARFDCCECGATVDVREVTCPKCVARGEATKAPAGADSVWLIEKQGAAPRWWRCSGPCGAWGTAQQAIRFARREDALAVARYIWPQGLPRDVGVTEHLFADVPGKGGADA